MGSAAGKQACRHCLYSRATQLESKRSSHSAELVAVVQHMLPDSCTPKASEVTGECHLLEEEDLVVMCVKAVQVGGAKACHGLTEALPKLIQLSLKDQLLLRLLREHARSSLQQCFAYFCHGCIVCADILLHGYTGSEHAVECSLE